MTGGIGVLDGLSVGSVKLLKEGGEGTVGEAGTSTPLRPVDWGDAFGGAVGADGNVSSDKALSSTSSRGGKALWNLSVASKWGEEVGVESGEDCGPKDDGDTIVCDADVEEAKDTDGGNDDVEDAEEMDEIEVVGVIGVKEGVGVGRDDAGTFGETDGLLSCMLRETFFEATETDRPFSFNAFKRSAIEPPGFIMGPSWADPLLLNG
jgi:hypothetical protein